MDLAPVLLGVVVVVIVRRGALAAAVIVVVAALFRIRVNLDLNVYSFLYFF